MCVALKCEGDIKSLLPCSCGPMMLDVLFKIKDEMDPTLAFRRSCRYALLPRFIVICFVLACGVSLSFHRASQSLRCLMQGGHLRLMCHEYKWYKRARVLD